MTRTFVPTRHPIQNRQDQDRKGIGGGVVETTAAVIRQFHLSRVVDLKMADLVNRLLLLRALRPINKPNLPNNARAFG
jgi:hypothetical protein